MRTLLTRAFLVLGAAAIGVMCIDYVTFAATGSSLVLGRTNKATHATTLQRTTPGPVVYLKTRSSKSAPLKVNGTGTVRNLSSDRVDGLSSEQLQRRVKSCPAGSAIRSVSATGAVTCGTLPRATEWVLPTALDGVSTLSALTSAYPAGTYLVSGRVTSTSVTASGGMSCLVYTAHPTTHAATLVGGNNSIISPSLSYCTVSVVVTTTSTKAFELYSDLGSAGTMDIERQFSGLTVTRLDGAGATGTLDVD